MKLSVALDLRLKELQVWRQEVILAIRKAFTFDDTVIQDGVSGIPFKQGLVFTRSKGGYGLRSGWYGIAVRPDVAICKVAITRTVRRAPSGLGDLAEESSVTYIDAPLTPGGTLTVDLVTKLQEEIVNFLASAELEFVPIDW